MGHERTGTKKPNVEPQARVETPLAASGALSLADGGAAAVLALQRSIGNRRTAEWIGRGNRALARQPAAVKDDIDRRMAEGDWHGAAWALAELPVAAIEARIKALSSVARQRLEEGARHGGGKTEDLLPIISKVSVRDAIIGSVRFFVWKHMWAEAGTYMCGLDDEDIRRVAGQLRLTFDDLRAIADAQTDPTQATRLNVAFFSHPPFVAATPRDRVDKSTNVLTWIAADKVVAPYAAAKWPAGAKPSVTVVSASKWGDFYAKRATGQLDPETGRALTAEDARRRAVRSGGFTTETDEIFLREGDNTPGALLHEAMHALAPSGFEDVLGRAVEEGSAEYFAHHVAASAGKHPPRAYADQLAGVKALADLVSDEMLAKAYFTGKTLELEAAVDAKRGEGIFGRWRRAMQEPDERAKAPGILSAAPAAVP